MNLSQELLTAGQNNSNLNPDYVRNLVKEILQDYALNYIYSSDYKRLIFTGGTCLKKNYGLNRLSEDLDFDIENNYDFKIEDFSKNLTDYFLNLDFKNVTYKIAKNNKTVLLKFDLSDIKTTNDLNITSNVVYLRCDFAIIDYEGYEVSVNPINTQNFSFFVKNYNLATLFSNKIGAFLQRDFYKGSQQKFPFKGRDVYDLFWLTSLSIKQSGEIKPNIEALKNRLAPKSIDEIRNEVVDKLNIVDPQYIYEDLLPLVSSRDYLENFIENYKPYLLEKLPSLIR